MGRSKGSQRSKGNTRPSSSGHSAELLNYSGKPLSGFVGFKVPSKDNVNDINVVKKTTTDNVDISVNLVFRLLMKKMMKRDAVTKLKALSEFNDFCSKEEKEVLKSVLPFWPRLFNKLALDYDRRVREATHKAHKTLLLKVKRDFAPYLKSIMGTWLIGQCDPYALSASAAQLAFSSAFPLPKQPEVLLFCKEDIFTFFQDNLFHNSSDSVRQSGCSNKSETNGPFDLIVTGTLRSMKLFLSLLSQKDQIKAIEEDVITIVSNKKFWEFVQNKNPQVRAAWYSVASIICCVMPEAFKTTMRKLVVAALSYLSEEDPAVAPVVWECALSAMSNFKDYWMFIDVQKVVLPQLWAFLKDGGKGNATVVFPCLLPLISQFPKDITEAESGFYKQLFHSMRKSLFLERIKSSSSECNAVIKSFFECLHYAVNRVSILDKEFDFLQQIVVRELFPLVESSFTTTGYHLPVSSLYPLLGQFLNFLEVKAQNEPMENQLSIFSESLTFLWNSMFSMFLKIVNQKNSQLQNSDLSCLAYFFHCLHKPSDTLIKRKKNVRFDTECDESDNQDMHDTLSLCAVNSKYKEHMSHEEGLLFQNTIKFCKVLWLRYEECLEPSYMKLLSEIISAACCVNLFSELLTVFNVLCKEKKEAPIIFYHTIILSWLKEIPCVSALDSIVDIIFCICSCVDKDSALGVLNDTCKVEYERLFIRLVDQALSHYKSDGIICKWLGSPIFGHALVYHIKNVTVLLNSRTVSQEVSISEAYCRSLYSCLVTDNGETLVDEECIKAILALFSHSFPDPATWTKCENINEYNIIDFVCETCEHIFDSSNHCWNYLAFDSLMFQLFDFTLSVNENDAIEKLVVKASSVWKKSLLCIAKKRKEGLRNGNFIHQASQKLHNLFLNLKVCKNPENLLEHTLMFLSLLEEAFCSEYLESTNSPFHIVSTVLENILPTEEEWKIMKIGLRLTILPFILQGVVFSPLYSDFHILDCDNLIPEYVLTSKVISDLLMKATSSTKLAMILKESIAKLLLKHLPQIIWSLTYATGNGYCKIENSNEYSCICKLEENSFELMKFLTKEDVFKLIHTLYDLSLSEGIVWSLPLQKTVMIVKLLYPDDMQIFFELTVEANKSDSCHRYITAQAFLSGVTQVKKNLLLKELTCNILTGEVFQDELNLFGMLSEVCCCIQELEVIKHSDDVESIITVLMEMIDLHSVFAASERSFLQFVTQVSRILYVVIENFSYSLNIQHWNLIIGLLTLWLKKCKKNQDTVIKISSLAILMHQTSLLLSLVTSKLNQESEKGGSGIELCPISKSKWEQVFQDLISNDFLTLFLQISESVEKFEKLPNAIEILLTTVCQATKHLTSLQILTTFIPSLANGEIVKDPIEQENCVHEMFQVLTPFLTSSIRSLQFAVHSIIIKIMPCIPKLLIMRNEIEDDGDMEGNISAKSFPLIEMLQYISNIVDTMLLGIKSGDCCIVQPYTDSYTYTMAYLLAWNEVIEFFTALSSEDRSGYASYLENSKLLSALLYNLIRLMPENPLSCIRKKESVTAESKLGSVFLEFPALHSSDSPSSKELQHVACNVYFNTLKKAPALVRAWWNNLDKRTAEIVERFTSRNVSGLLSQQEIQAVQDANTRFENMTVKARPLSKEVLATYTLDDSTIELSIQLPPNYPLGPIVADSHGKIVVGQARWRNWLLQLTTFLNYQNGFIVDALSLWKKNLDKKFEGIEECMICFYVIHSSSYKLPNFSCSTCKKKFHSSCLFKWFSTSNNSTCPLCRNYF